jgi:hypothetical protein
VPRCFRLVRSTSPAYRSLSLDGSPASRNFIDALRASITFHVVAWQVSKQPEQAFRASAAHAALIVPVSAMIMLV